MREKGLKTGAAARAYMRGRWDELWAVTARERGWREEEWRKLGMDDSTEGSGNG